MKSVVSLSNCTQFCIAKLLWGSSIDKINDSELPIHREKAETKINFLNLPLGLKSSLRQNLRVVELAYADALDWCDLYKDNISIMEYWNFRFVNEPQYCCKAYLLPTGEFDDLAFVRNIVRDRKKPILDRFHFACFYCLETDIKKLWQQLSFRNRQSLGQSTLVQFWIDRLITRGNGSIEIEERKVLTSSVVSAVRSGHEAAVYYFWQKLSIEEQTALQNDKDKYFFLILDAARKGHCKIMHFLYSQLNLQQQLRFLKFDMSIHLISNVWVCYIYSPFVWTIPEQIKRHHRSLHAVAFSSVLCNLACDLKDPIFLEIFWKVWHLGSAVGKDFVLRNDLYILEKFFCMKYFTCAELLLKECSFERKRKFLFSDLEIVIIEKFVFYKDWASIERHLLLFLVDLHKAGSNLKTFHVGSLALLKEFQEESWFAKWVPKISIESAERLQTIFRNIRHEIEISILVNDLLTRTDKIIDKSSLGQKYLL